MEVRGFFILENKFFDDFPDPYLKRNENENRPHYYCFKSEDDLYWMIPTSARYEKYQNIINKRNKTGKSTEFIYISKLDNGITNAFLIGDMFPVTEEYIKREYTFNGSHLKITSAKLGDQIEKQAKVILGLLKLGYKFSPTQPDVLKIEKLLLDKKSKIKGENSFEQIC